MQIARVYQGRPSKKTLVLASIDGSHLGQAGARRLIEVLPEPDLVDAVVVVSDLGARGGGPPVQAWSNDSTRAGIALQRTVAESIRLELGSAGGGSGTFGQLARLSFPIGIGAQGVLLDLGLRRGADLGQRGAAARRQRAAGGHRPRPAGRAGPRNAQDAHGPRRGPAPGARAEELSAGGEPGAAGVGAVAARGRAPAAGARGVGRRVRARPQAPPRRAEVAALARRLGRAVPRGARGGAVPRARRRHTLAAGGAGAARRPSARRARPGGARRRRAWRWCWRSSSLAGWPRAPTPSSARRPTSGPAWRSASPSRPRSILLWLVNPYAGLLAVPAAHLWMLLALTRPLPDRRVRGRADRGGRRCPR